VTEAFHAALIGAGRIATRLTRSLATLAPLAPFDAATIAGLDDAAQDAIDAFPKRFESLVAQLQDQVWRQALLAEDEDPDPLSRRDIAARMEKLGLLGSADAFSRAVVVRNRLSHAYPNDPARLAARLNDAIALAPVLLDAVATANAWAARRAGSG